ncbi:hypothetical protein AOX55_00005259 (plasmid) [Sinorhizobium fredii CCBAU 25509]|nr:hypothetical protein SF83666_b52870 [Sinorhizobium fredii CCBAU 83666]AWM28037.1 hypothetical protein AOX55_00005259 [Sinorhizobium fredii CCBAU 25509]
MSPSRIWRFDTRDHGGVTFWARINTGGSAIPPRRHHQITPRQKSKCEIRRIYRIKFRS